MRHESVDLLMHRLAPGRYVVTRASDDGTFLVGDHITAYADGDLGCDEAKGWIPAAEVEEATRGMRFVAMAKEIAV